MNLEASIVNKIIAEDGEKKADHHAMGGVRAQTRSKLSKGGKSYTY